MNWKPGVSGLFRQNGKFGIMFTVSNCDSQFIDPGNQERLRTLLQRMEKIRQLFGARQKTFAGILPGIFFRSRMVREIPESEVTVGVIGKVIEAVKFSAGLSADAPIIILGGCGFIGNRVAKSLPRDVIHIVDIAGKSDEHGWPNQLRGKPALLLNISRSAALGEYVGRFWPELVVVNEVYPEPSPELEILRTKLSLENWGLTSR